MIEVSVMPGVVSTPELKEPFGSVQFHEGITAGDVMVQLGITNALILVNGAMTNKGRRLSDGDLVRFMVAMGGG